MDLAGFHTLVSGVVNRGTRYDTDIVTMTRQAARWVERNHSLHYMNNLGELTILENENSLLIPSAHIKSIRFFRLVITAESKYHWLTKGDPQDFSSYEADRPSKYWLETAPNRMVLNVLSDAEYESELFYVAYTDWPTDTDEEHWLIDNAEDLLLAQTLIYMAPILRSRRLAAEYGPLKAEALRTLLLADEELQQENASHAMNMYVG